MSSQIESSVYPSLSQNEMSRSCAGAQHIFKVVRATGVLADHRSDTIFAPRFKPQLLAKVERAGRSCLWD
jgi:hypothetical protein